MKKSNCDQNIVSRTVYRYSIVLGLSLSAMLPGAAFGADEFPTRPINIIIPFTPGGAGSTLVRLVEPIMRRELGQPLVIENKGGAGGVLGAQVTKAAPADGYTVFTPSNTIVVDAVLRPDIGYDYRKDFTPVSKLAYSPHYLMVRGDLPVNNLKEFVAYAKQNPGKVLYAHSGIGGATHVTGEMFKAEAGVDIKDIPFKGTAEQLTAILNGSVQATWDFVSNWKDYAAKGDVKILAVAGPQRDPSLPNVPTVAETYPGFESGAWVGIFARSGTPKVAIDRISAAAQKAVKDPDTAEKLRNIGYTPIGNSAADFAATLNTDFEKYTKVVQKANMLGK